MFSEVEAASGVDSSSDDGRGSEHLVVKSNEGQMTRGPIAVQMSEAKKAGEVTAPVSVMIFVRGLSRHKTQ